MELANYPIMLYPLSYTTITTHRVILLLFYYYYSIIIICCFIFTNAQDSLGKTRNYTIHRTDCMASTVQ